jgi:hypothetical protein
MPTRDPDRELRHRDPDRERRKQIKQKKREIEAQERRRSTPKASDADEDDEQGEAAECWICYSGKEEGELISPCKCRGSMRWVHRDCLHKWITTRVTEYQPDQWGEGGAREASNRFACPNCETKFEFVAAADGQPDQSADKIWPSSGRWWWPNLFPRIDRLYEIDPEVCDSYRWKCAAPLLCTAVQAMLVVFTCFQVRCLTHYFRRGLQPIIRC